MGALHGGRQLGAGDSYLAVVERDTCVRWGICFSGGGVQRWSVGAVGCSRLCAELPTHTTRQQWTHPSATLGMRSALHLAHVSFFPPRACCWRAPRAAQQQQGPQLECFWCGCVAHAADRVRERRALAAAVRRGASTSSSQACGWACTHAVRAAQARTGEQQTFGAGGPGCVAVVCADKVCEGIPSAAPCHSELGPLLRAFVSWTFAVILAGLNGQALTPLQGGAPCIAALTRVCCAVSRAPLCSGAGGTSTGLRGALPWVLGHAAAVVRLPCRREGWGGAIGVRLHSQSIAVAIV
jgi:hypothetical protein